MTSGTSWLLRGAVIAALGALSAGCGGLGPGDYVIYRVAQTTANEGNNCPGADNPDVTSDSSSFLETGTFILYAGVEETFYLDNGSQTLEGTFADDVYSFAGKATDVEFEGLNDEIKTTTTISTTVTMTVDGASVAGSSSTKASFKCTGTNCPDDFSCTTTFDFVGTEVEEIELEHGI